MSSLWVRRVLLDGVETDIRIRDGYIERIGSGPDGAAGEPAADEILDGRGRKAILPAFYNAHTHAAMSLLRGYADDLPLFEWLHNHIWPIEAKMTAEDIYAGTRLACLEMIRSGTVFFNDMYWHHAEAIRAVSEMGLRACMGPLLLDAFSPEQTRRQRDAAVAFLADLDRLPAGVIPSLSPHSVYGVTPETLAWVGEQAASARMILHTHLCETRKEVEDCVARHGCSPVELLHRLNLLTPRTVAAHVLHLTDAERALLGESGVAVAHMPASNMKLCNGAFDVPAARRHGLRLLLGTDGCSSNNSLDMMQEMKFAALLAKHASADPTVLPAGDAFRAATRDAAEAFGLPAGVIEPGRLADFMLVDLDSPRLTPGHNLVSDLVYSADSSVIDTVVCGGRVLMRDRQVPGEDAILREARAAGRRLREAS